MGRSQRGLRGPAREESDSAGESHFPSTEDGYEYDWANIWPSGTPNVPPVVEGALATKKKVKKKD